MEVILFYALLIGGLALAAAAYLTLLIVPVGLVAHRFGPAAGTGFAATLLAALYAFYEPPYGGTDLSFAPAGIRPNLFLVGMVQDPPFAMLAAGAAVSISGLAFLLFTWLRGRSRPS